MKLYLPKSADSKTDLTWTKEELENTRKMVTLHVGPIQIPVNKEVVIYSLRLKATLPGTDEKIFDTIGHNILSRF